MPNRGHATAPPDLAAELLRDGARLIGRIRARELDDDPAEVVANVRAMLLALSLGADGPRPAEEDPTAAPRATGRRKAAQGVPLPRMLHAYRVAGRVVWEELVELAVQRDGEASLVHVASQLWTMFDEYTGLAAQAHQEYVAERDRQDATARRLALTSLLDGTVDSSTRASQILTVLGVPGQGHYLVVAVESETAPAEDLEPLLAGRGIASAWIDLPGRRVGLLGVPPGVVMDALPLLERTATGRVGVSRPFDQPAAAATARHEAQLATACVPPGAGGVHVYGDSPVSLLVATAADDVRDLARAVLAPVTSLPGEESTPLLTTLRAWFANDGSTTATAAGLHVHRNTVLYRLNRIGDLTGCSVNHPAQATDLLLALRAMDLSPA